MAHVDVKYKCAKNKCFYNIYNTRMLNDISALRYTHMNKKASYL